MNDYEHGSPSTDKYIIIWIYKTFYKTKLLMQKSRTLLCDFCKGFRYEMVCGTDAFCTLSEKELQFFCIRLLMSFRNPNCVFNKIVCVFLSDCASIPARRIVSIALLIVLRKFVSLLSPLCLYLDFVVFGTELIKMPTSSSSDLCWDSPKLFLTEPHVLKRHLHLSPLRVFAQSCIYKSICSW